MTYYPRNGRTIKIPVQSTKRQLPVTDKAQRPMLDGPVDDQQSATNVQDAATRAVNEWKAQVDRLQAELKDREAQVLSLQSELEELRARVSELESEASGAHLADLDAWKEEVARLRNRENEVRRRAEHRAETEINEERERLVNRLLSIADNLQRALAHADENDPLYAGLRLTFIDLMEQLKKEGVQPIPALGRAFDPNLHEAVATDGSGGNTVVKVLDTGYTLNGDLLRPARVVVGTYPS